MSALLPIFVNCRDRVTDLRELVAWLERAGHERIILIDNDSTWEPLLEYLATSPHEVLRMGENCGSKALWNRELVPDEPFVYTDPDVVPVEDCPTDAVLHLSDILERAPAHCWKAGLGLKLDDVPRDGRPMEWEESLVSADREIEPGVFDSLVDTTFALYRPSAPFNLYGIRTGAPYQVRHMPWYAEDLSDENRHYLERAVAGPWGSEFQVGAVGRTLKP